ncbi:MAG: shikimate dehydrogenase [Candidatus Omnitrophica bacterium]|nr:shikimate dehydrogenase [Candidatus Omnitrophota bacterium]
MTRLFGILGHPVSHSLSPAMHTAALRAMRLDAFYTPFDVPPRFLEPVVRALELAGVDGLNVTVPHKQHILRHLDPQRGVASEAKAIGAVNTLVRKEGRFVGHNTDVEGFRRALKEDLGCNCRDQQVVLLGAGGAARAVGWALLSMRPRTIFVVNRTPARAAQFVHWLQASSSGGMITTVPFERRAVSRLLEHSTLLVNATTLGLRPKDPLPVDPQAIHKRLAVFDLVYRRPTTALVRAARARGALAIDGIPMLLYQGAESLRLWLRREPPIRVMRHALERAVRAMS